jgi:hypothetical protein
MSQRTETEIATELLTIQAAVELHHQRHAEQVHRGRVRTIELARRYGMSWELIGHALGISGDTARKQYERGL